MGVKEPLSSLEIDCPKWGGEDNGTLYNVKTVQKRVVEWGC